jgi:hypothetical protein
MIKTLATLALLAGFTAAAHAQNVVTVHKNVRLIPISTTAVCMTVDDLREYMAGMEYRTIFIGKLDLAHDNTLPAAVKSDDSTLSIAYSDKFKSAINFVHNPKLNVSCVIGGAKDVTIIEENFRKIGTPASAN